MAQGAGSLKCCDDPKGNGRDRIGPIAPARPTPRNMRQMTQAPDFGSATSLRGATVLDRLCRPSGLSRVDPVPAAPVAAKPAAAATPDPAGSPAHANGRPAVCKAQDC